MQIQAAVLRAPDAPYVIEDVELADPGPGQVRVRIVSAGVCHTDVLPRVPDYPANPPVVTGHEGAGVVEALGDGVTDLAVGDHVVLSFDFCGECANCVGGHPAYCDTAFARNLIGDGLPGTGVLTDASGTAIGSRWFGQSSFATHAVVNARAAVPVDRDLPLELLGPLGCGVQTGAASVLTALSVQPGTSFVVFGAGGVGLSAIMAARLVGATTIVAVDLNSARLALATELGATHTLDGADGELLARIVDLTGGGAQYTFDTTGLPSVISVAVNSLRPTGVCGLVGVQQGDVVLDPTAVAFGRTVMGIIEGDAVPRAVIPQLLRHWRNGEFPFDKLITTFAFDQINEAEQASLTGEVVKPVLEVSTV